MTPLKQRLAKLQKTLNAQELILLTKDTDVFYFTGFKSLVTNEREAYLLISQNEIHLFYTPFSPISKYNFISYHPSASINKLVEYLQQKEQINLLFIDNSSLLVSEFQELKKINCQIKELSKESIWQLRIIKDKTEAKLLQQAGQLSLKAWEELKASQFKTGITEKELAKALKSILFKLNSDGEAFPMIVAFGENTALAHHQPTSKKLEKEMPILIDFGAKIAAYGSDMTRTTWFGNQTNAEFIQIKNIVKQAYLAGVNQLKKYFKVINLTGHEPITEEEQQQALTGSITAKDIDDVVRTVIKQAGYGDKFIHTTGHGIGLDIHEPPSLSFKNNQKLQAGMAITIEPGIYLPGRFGVRYENSFLLA